MNVSKLSIALVGASLFLPAAAFAANMNKKSLHLYENVTVEGHKLAPGDYKVEWSGSGPEVKVNILKGKETVASAPARIVTQSESNSQDGYALKPGKNGNQTLAQVFFSGEKYDLNIGAGSDVLTAPTAQAPVARTDGTEALRSFGS